MWLLDFELLIITTLFDKFPKLSKVKFLRKRMESLLDGIIFLAEDLGYKIKID
jgi:hypothetical protein